MEGRKGGSWRGPGTTDKGVDSSPAPLGPVRQRLEGLCFQVDIVSVVVKSETRQRPMWLAMPTHRGPVASSALFLEAVAATTIPSGLVKQMQQVP